jgi:glutathione S-transferase
MDAVCSAYCKRIMELPAMQEWVEEAQREPDDIEELDAEF